ncbi:MAG TPA: hypothetical protein VES73_17175 [Lamprocystis sp. (in: g-proteobacteria)]|nr:hypothetical protein [Lamprocystis sp. (in: g-proteobacteria)]
MALITFFIQLCLLRRTPQDLPASDALFWLVLAADLCAGLLIGLVGGLGLGISLIQGGTQLALLLGLLYLGLYFTRHPGRFTQSATALLGSGALISFIAAMVLTLNPTGSEESDAATLGAIMLLVLMVWSIVVTGHIARHTFSISLGQGLSLAIAYEVVAVSLIAWLFAGA